MRNTAKNGCPTDYTFVIDIDMIPNAGFELELQHFLTDAENCKAKNIRTSKNSYYFADLLQWVLAKYGCQKGKQNREWQIYDC